MIRRRFVISSHLATAFLPAGHSIKRSTAPQELTDAFDALAFATVLSAAIASCALAALLFLGLWHGIL